MQQIRWLTEFDACLDWNHKALESGNGKSDRQLLDNCLESDRASALLMVEQITPDTPIRGATGCNKWIPPWKLPESKFDHEWNGGEIPGVTQRSLLGVASGVSFEDRRWNVCCHDTDVNIFLGFSGVLKAIDNAAVTCWTRWIP